MLPVLDTQHLLIIFFMKEDSLILKKATIYGINILYWDGINTEQNWV